MEQNMQNGMAPGGLSKLWHFSGCPKCLGEVLQASHARYIELPSRSLVSP